MNKKLTFKSILFISVLYICNLNAQFVDNFEGSTIELNSKGINGWAFHTGDGTATMDFTSSGKGMQL